MGEFKRIDLLCAEDFNEADHFRKRLMLSEHSWDGGRASATIQSEPRRLNVQKTRWSVSKPAVDILLLLLLLPFAGNFTIYCSTYFAFTYILDADVPANRK